MRAFFALVSACGAGAAVLMMVGVQHVVEPFAFERGCWE